MEAGLSASAVPCGFEGYYSELVDCCVEVEFVEDRGYCFASYAWAHSSPHLVFGGTAGGAKNAGEDHRV